jgi:hypothetical protein
MKTSASSHLLFGRTRRLLLACVVVFLGSGVAASATTVVPPEFPTLVNESDYIVRAITTRVVAEKRTGPRGAKIYTRVDLQVIEVIAGTPPPQLTLEFLGGRVGAEVMTVAGTPQFTVGDEDILFVRDNGRSICPLYAMMHGRYVVSTEAATGSRYVARSDGTPLRDAAQIATALVDPHAVGSQAVATSAASALTPADFAGQIRAALRPDARALRAK